MHVRPGDILVRLSVSSQHGGQEREQYSSFKAEERRRRQDAASLRTIIHCRVASPQACKRAEEVISAAQWHTRIIA